MVLVNLELLDQILRARAGRVSTAHTTSVDTHGPRA
jgi:hypothetical protein